MIFAQILNDLLHHKFIADEQPQYAPDIIIVDITGIVPEPQEGWGWNGAAFTPPLPPDPIVVAAAARTLAMTTGALYAGTGVTVPFTSADALGLMQVQAAFALGVTSTVIALSNGQKLPMTPAEFPGFAAWFVQRRNQFFQE